MKVENHCVFTWRIPWYISLPSFQTPLAFLSIAEQFLLRVDDQTVVFATSCRWPRDNVLRSKWVPSCQQRLHKFPHFPD
jgi:hypothetical protein